MINYSSKEHTLKVIDIEKLSLTATLDIQKSLNKQILVFMKNYVGSMKVNAYSQKDNEVYKYLNGSTEALNKSNSNIEHIEQLLDELKFLTSSYNNLSTDDLKYKIDEYNKNFSDGIDTIYDNTSNIQNFIHDISLLDISQVLNTQEEQIVQEAIEESPLIITEELDKTYVENTLVISEIQGKVFLPYKLSDIKNILEKSNKYSSIENVIEKKYTKPIKNYRLASLARFKEAYKLVVDREHGSRYSALSLATELFTNFNLHPAIITACNSLDELDIYLACLEDNALEDFKYFNIKYEIAPVVSLKLNPVSGATGKHTK